MPQKHRVRNWSFYNKALKKRGDLFFYFNENFLKNDWLFNGRRAPGGKRKYSDATIQMMLSVKNVLRLPLRQAQGFAESIMKRLGYMLPVPDFSTISRRARTLGKRIHFLNKLNPKEPLHLLIDSTGLSVYSGTYFHTTKYQSNRKLCKGAAWKKLHVVYDVENAQVVNATLSESAVQDAAAVKNLIPPLANPVGSICADRAYDKASCYQTAFALEARAIIPPVRNARLQKDNRKPPQEYLETRDKAIAFIRKHPSYEEGVKEWKKQSGYHKRSRIEAFMNRFKKAFGFTIQSKTCETMLTEAIIKINILNLQASLGMPHCELVTS